MLAAKKNIRTFGRKKKQTGLTVYALNFDTAATDFKKAKVWAKCKFYTTEIKEEFGDQGALFRISNHVLNKDTDPPLPAHEFPEALAEDFICFSMTKLLKFKQG